MKWRSYSLLILLIIVLASCSSKNVKVPVPSDAALVIHIGAKDSSFPWKELQNSSFIKFNADGEMDSLTMQILENPESAGVDFSDGFFYFMKNRRQSRYYVITFALKDDDKFAELVKKASRHHEEATATGEIEIKKEKGLNIVEAGRELITWNSSRAVVIGETFGIERPVRDFDDPSDYKAKILSRDSLIKFANEVYDIKESASINSDKRFAELLTQKGQLHVWVNSKETLGDVLAALPINSGDRLVEGNVHTATFNFDKGKITGDSKSYYNQQLSAYYAKNPPKNIDEEMLKKIPGENVSAVFAMNYPMPVLKDMLALTGADTWANLTLRGMDVKYSLNDIINLMKGDFFIACSDVTIPTRTDNVNLNKTVGWDDEHKKGQPMISAKIIGGIALSDSAGLESMLAYAKGKMEESGELFSVAKDKFPYKIKGGWLVSSSDEATMNNFGKSSIDHPFIRRIAGHPIGGYIDMQKLATGLKSGATKPFEKFIADETSAVWQDIVFYGGEFKDSVQIGHFEVNFVDKNTHSLIILSDFMEKFRQQSKISASNSWNTNQDGPLSKEELLKMFDSIPVDRKKVKIEEARP